MAGADGAVPVQQHNEPGVSATPTTQRRLTTPVVAALDARITADPKSPASYPAKFGVLVTHRGSWAGRARSAAPRRCL
jgi:hypothetical protein